MKYVVLERLVNLGIAVYYHFRCQKKNLLFRTKSHQSPLGHTRLEHANYGAGQTGWKRSDSCNKNADLSKT